MYLQQNFQILKQTQERQRVNMNMEALQKLTSGKTIAVRYQIGTSSTHRWFVGRVIEISSMFKGHEEDGFYRITEVRFNNGETERLTLFSTGYKARERGGWVRFKGHDKEINKMLTDAEVDRLRKKKNVCSTTSAL